MGSSKETVCPVKLLLHAMIFLTLLCATGCGPSRDWNGTWVLDKSRSEDPSPAIVITTDKQETYRLDAGSSGYSFSCDGSEYKTVSNRSLQCTQPSPSVIDSTSYIDGAVIQKDHWEISSDGNSLSITTYFTGGQKAMYKHKYRRLDKSSGFTGSWASQEPFGDGDRTLQIRLDRHSLHLSHLENGEYADIPLDGSNASIHGGTIQTQTNISLKPNGAREFITRLSTKSHTITEGVLELSNNGQMLVEKHWVPGSSQKSELVYERRQ